MRWWDRLDFRIKMTLMIAVLVLLIVVLGVFLNKGVGETLDYIKELRSVCVECHTECEKNEDYSWKCLNCHKKNVCDKGNEFQRNKTKGERR
jgi:hypothetical protein